MTERIIASQELLPVRCEKCSSEEQQYYFRSFTDPSYNLFLHNFYKSPSYKSFNRNKYGNYSIPTTYLNRPGTFWTSTDPIFSYAVGLSRGVVENQNIRFMIMNCCSHDIAATSPYNVSGSEKKESKTFYKVRPITTNINYEEVSPWLGTIFPQLSPEQIVTSKWYKIPRNYLSQMRAEHIQEEASQIEEIHRLFGLFYDDMNVLYNKNELQWVESMVQECKLEYAW